jgi:hypothetical protein
MKGCYAVHCSLKEQSHEKVCEIITLNDRYVQTKIRRQLLKL